MEQRRLPIFAERFSQLRGEKTQGEFADFLGISRPTVGFYENGSRIPDALVLRQISERCNVSSDWLIGISDVKTPDTTIQDISKNTGLSEGAIMMLQQLKYCSDQNGSSSLDILNSLLDNWRMLFLLTKIYGLKQRQTLNAEQAKKLIDSLELIESDFVESSPETVNKMKSAVSQRIGEFRTLERYTKFEIVETFTDLIDAICPSVDWDAYSEKCYTNELFTKLAMYAREQREYGLADFIEGVGDWDSI